MLLAPSFLTSVFLSHPLAVSIPHASLAGNDLIMLVTALMILLNQSRGWTGKHLINLRVCVLAFFFLLQC